MKMAGRPPKFKKAMTAAQRMRRYRSRRKEIDFMNRETAKAMRNARAHGKEIAVNEATLKVTRTRNTHKLRASENPMTQWRHAAITAQIEVSVLQARLREFEVASNDLDRRSDVDELARQIAEWLQLSPGTSVNDVRDAIDRRFGPSRS